MTLADVLKPSLLVIAHAETRGLTIGAGVGALVAIPTLAIKPSLINPSDSDCMVAIANAAGIGAITGATVISTACAVKLSKLDADAIKNRADLIMKNCEQRRLDIAAIDGAIIGLGVVCNRFYKLSKANDTSFSQEAFTKTSAWEAFGFTVLGASIGAGGLLLFKYSAKGIKALAEKIKKAKEENKDTVVQVTQGVENTVEQVAQAAEQVSKQMADTASEAVEKATVAGEKAKEAVKKTEDKLKEQVEKQVEKQEKA